MIIIVWAVIGEARLYALRCRIEVKNTQLKVQRETNKAQLKMIDGLMTRANKLKKELDKYKND